MLSKEVLLSGGTIVFSVVALVLFVRELLKKNSRPYIWSWIIRFALVVVAFASQFASGATYSLMMSGGQLVSCLVIIGLIVYTQPRMGKLRRADWMALATAGVGVAWWMLSGNPLHGLLGVIIADTAATALGIHASVTRKARESYAFWMCSFGAASTALLAAEGGNVVVVLAPLFSALNAGVNIAAVLYVKKTRKKAAPVVVAATD